MRSSDWLADETMSCIASRHAATNHSSSRPSQREVINRSKASSSVCCCSTPRRLSFDGLESSCCNHHWKCIERFKYKTWCFPSFAACALKCALMQSMRVAGLASADSPSASSNPERRFNCASRLPSRPCRWPFGSCMRPSGSSGSTAACFLLATFLFWSTLRIRLCHHHQLSSQGPDTNHCGDI